MDSSSNLRDLARRYLDLWDRQVAEMGRAGHGDEASTVWVQLMRQLVPSGGQTEEGGAATRPDDDS